MEKNSAFQIRVSEKLKDAFMKKAADNNKQGSQLVREFMENYVKGDKK